MTLDSLRYYVDEFHVDGFRFDLATVHGRQNGGAFDPEARLFSLLPRKIRYLRQVSLSRRALGSRRLCRRNTFPRMEWMEWNGGFGDITRRWVRGDSNLLPALRDKLEGSAEVL